MRTDDLQKLLQKYPKLYKHNISFECHNGWYALIDQLSKKLEALIYEDGDCFPIQVKEKFGTLRFYMNSETEEMSDLIDKAEAKSAETCEICGAKGTLRSHFRWLFTRCETHKDV
jgi:hypothetical protein